MPRYSVIEPKPAAPPKWKQQLAALGAGAGRTDPVPSIVPDKKQICYVIDTTESLDEGRVPIELGWRTRKAGGDWGKIRLYNYSDIRGSDLKDPRDKEILGLISGASNSSYSYYDDPSYESARTWRARYVLESPLLKLSLPMICATGRCFLDSGKADGDQQSVE